MTCGCWQSSTHAMLPPTGGARVVDKFRVFLVGSPYQDERYRRIAEGLAGCDIVRYSDQAAFATDPSVRTADVILLDRFFKATREIMADAPRLRAVDLAARRHRPDRRRRGDRARHHRRARPDAGEQHRHGGGDGAADARLAGSTRSTRCRLRPARQYRPPDLAAGAGSCTASVVIGLVGYGKIARGVCDLARRLGCQDQGL